MDVGGDHGAPVLAAPPPVLAHIFSFLSGRDCAAAACACPAFRAVLDSEPNVWAHCCSVDFGLAPDDVTQEAQELQQRGGAAAQAQGPPRALLTCRGTRTPGLTRGHANT